ncbi:hypothetical protein MMC11_004572 [Xylographa trunciseda]|nr:hypothetical protein [Xylographa trunciseda]
MARHYYRDLNPGDYYRRSTRVPPMNIAHPSRESSRVHTMGSLTIQESPPRDSDSEKNQHPRRRIAVASKADLYASVHDVGREKSNVVAIQEMVKDARTAKVLVKKVAPVNSQNFGYAEPHCPWPYQSNGTSSIPSQLSGIGADFSTYPPSTSCPISSYTPTSISGISSAARGQLSGNYTALPYQSVPNRTTFANGYGSNLVDGVYDSYTNQYGLPAQESQGAAALFGHQDSSRHWSMPDRYGLTYEPELPGKYAPATLSYSESGLSSGPGPNDSSSYFSMSNLATTLPAPIRSNGRGLPTRQRGDILPFPIDNGNGSNLGMAVGFTPFVSQHSISKASALWSPERAANGRSHTPTSTDSLGAGAFSLSLSSNKASTSPPDTRQTEFGYLTHSPPTSSTARTPESASNSKASVSTATMDNHGVVNSAYDTGLSSDPFLRRDFSTSNIYTYSTGSGTKSDPQASIPSEATLLNGQPYTHLRHPQSQEPLLYDGQRRRSSDATSQLAHRKSIASVGSSRR